MKTLTIFSFAILALTIGCDNAPAQNNGYGNHQLSQAVPLQNQNNGGNLNSGQQYTQAPQTQNNTEDEITMHPVMNSQTGQPSMYIPFPASWKFIDGAEANQPAMSGPNGLTIIMYEPQSYFYSNNQQFNQVYQANGQQVLPPTGIDKVINQMIIPQGQQMGMTLLNQYPLPTIAENDAQFVNKLIGGNSGQNRIMASGTEWTDREGNKALVVTHYHELASDGMVNWGYTVEMLKVKASSFDKSKSQYIYAISNKVYNQNEINAHNTQLANKLKADNDNFQANEKIRRDGASERAANTAATNEYIRNSNQASYEYRMHNNDILQEQESNYLNDINVVVSPIDGKEYQVESGSQTYWINDKGVYIKSDDPLYDPNKYETHPNVWQQAPQKVYK